MNNNTSDLKLDGNKLLVIAGEAARLEYGGLLERLSEEQGELFMEITTELQREYLQYALGPEGEKAMHRENMESLKNALAAVHNVAAIETYRTTVRVVGRVLAAVIKSAASSLL